MDDLYKKNPLYQTIELFCKVRGVSISAMCKSAGIRPGIVTDLKMGRKGTIQVETASKISEALGCDVDTFINNRYHRGPDWDVDTCLKWLDADSIEDQIYLLVNYGVDTDFFLNSQFPERKRQLEHILFDQAYPQKEKPNPQTEIELSETDIKLLEVLKSLTDAEKEFVYAHAQWIKSNRTSSPSHPESN